MATLGQLQGRLLEVAILPLLEASGYQTIRKPKHPMVVQGSKGLEVPGRSGFHQIDGIADFFLSPPLSHPHRLLVEGKFHLSDKVEIDVIRNAIGVLKDVSEFWVTAPPKNSTQPSVWAGAIPKSRYHYQYAIIASTPFTGPAQAYAFAHDIYLLPLGNSQYFQPVLDTIKALTPSTFGADTAKAIDVKLSQLRQALLSRIYPSEDADHFPLNVPLPAIQPLENFCQACREVKVAILATIGEQFPLVLIPNPKHINEQIAALLASETTPGETAQFRRDQKGEGWLLNYRGEDLFSFDLPERLFQLYAEQDALTWTNNSQGDASLRLQTTLVNLGKYVSRDFDNQIHQIELKLSHEAFRQFQSELNRS